MKRYLEINDYLHLLAGRRLMKKMMINIGIIITSICRPEDKNYILRRYSQLLYDLEIRTSKLKAAVSGT